MHAKAFLRKGKKGVGKTYFKHMTINVGKSADGETLSRHKIFAAEHEKSLLFKSGYDKIIIIFLNINSNAT